MELYNKYADWWHLFSSPEEYREEADLYWAVISRYKPNIREALELGSGGGNNAYFLKHKCQFTLTDISPEMIRVSQLLNPDCEHLVGDMRYLDLNRQFDLVFIHDAIMHLTSEADLDLVFQVARKHLKPDGILFIAPDFFKETFRPSTDDGGHDDGPVGVRYLEWTFDPNPEDDLVETHYVYLIRPENGQVEVVHDKSIEGLFSKNTWQALLEKNGFSVSFEQMEHSELEPGSYFGIVGR